MITFQPKKQFACSGNWNTKEKDFNGNLTAFCLCNLFVADIPVFTILFFANGVQHQRMTYHIKIKQRFNCILNVLNARVAKLHYLLAIHTNKVVVLSAAIRFFK